MQYLKHDKQFVNTFPNTEKRTARVEEYFWLTTTTKKTNKKKNMELVRQF